MRILLAAALVLGAASVAVARAWAALDRMADLRG